METVVSNQTNFVSEDVLDLFYLVRAQLNAAPEVGLVEIAYPTTYKYEFEALYTVSQRILKVYLPRPRDQKTNVLNTLARAADDEEDDPLHYEPKAGIRKLVDEICKELGWPMKVQEGLRKVRNRIDDWAPDSRLQLRYYPDMVYSAQQANKIPGVNYRIEQLIEARRKLNVKISKLEQRKGLLLEAADQS